MIIEGRVGAQNLKDGSQGPLRMGFGGEQVVSELKGRYAEMARRGQIFGASSQAVVTTTVGTATTYTGLVVANPVGSTVTVELLKATVMQSVIQATQIEAFALGVGSNKVTQVTHTTPITPYSTLVGSGATPVALADSAATLPTTPVYAMPLGNTSTATANNTGIIVDIEGSIILLPGAYAMFLTPTQASVAGMWFSMMWAENPL